MTNQTEKKTVLITGATSGMGQMAALKFARQDYIVYATTRDLNAESVKELSESAKKENLSIIPVYLDLLDFDSIEKAVKKVIDESGKLDVLINNAGTGYFGAVEDLDLKKFNRQFNVNVTGPLKLIQQVVPYMREQKKGLIINVSSIMGFCTAPLNTPYSVSKYAIESMTETLALEVRPFGIDVVIVQPGNFHTKFIKNADFEDKDPNSPYKKLYARRYSKSDEGGRDPQIMADLYLRIAQTENPKLRYMAGKEVLIRKLLHTVLVDGLWIKFLRHFYKW